LTTTRSPRKQKRVRKKGGDDRHNKRKKSVLYPPDDVVHPDKDSRAAALSQENVGSHKRQWAQGGLRPKMHQGTRHTAEQKLFAKDALARQKEKTSEASVIFSVPGGTRGQMAGSTRRSREELK